MTVFPVLSRSNDVSIDVLILGGLETHLGRHVFKRQLREQQL
jgi:hypothetical protein